MKILIFSALLLLLPLTAQGASFFFSPEQVETKIGARFEVKFIIDTEEEVVNAIEGMLKIPDGLRVVEILHGSSLITLWIERPNVRENTVYFSGITPGGFQGEIGVARGAFIPGVVFTLILESVDRTTKNILPYDMVALLGDGKGTAAKVTTNSFTYVHSETEADFSLENDDVPPEEFFPVVIEDALLGEKSALIFSTRDAQSGISHFEVKEGENDWVVTESPYVIRDQTLQSNMVVKAVDKAGNIRLAEVPAHNQGTTNLFVIWILSIIMLVAVLVTFFFKKLND